MAKHVWTTEKLTAADLNDTVDYLEDLAGGALSGQFAQDADTTAGLVFGYKGGNFRNDNTITAIDDGTVTLTDDTTNYVEVAAAGVTANTTGFTSGRNPLFVITTADGAITTVVDKRAVAFMSNAPGDMTKAVYDTDNDGIVDAAESAPWSGITDKPTSFTPSTHASTHGDGGADEIDIDASQITTGTMAVARLPVMGGASSIAAGTGGIVPAPAAGDDTKFLNGAGNYVSPPGLDGTVVSINGESGVVVLDSSYVGLGNVTNDAQLKAADLDTDSTFAADSDSKIPSQKAVKTALDGKVSSSTTQTANRIFSGPSSGSAAAPTFRALVSADLPTGISAANIGDGSVSNTEFEYLNGVTSNIQDQLNAAGGGSWGSITGTLADQTDLQSALDAKQATITLTTTGTSGAATLSAGTLNIPQYTGGGTALSIDSITSSATPGIDVDTYNYLEITALAEDATFAAPTGTPTDGQLVAMRITDDGTSRALAWNEIYRSANNNDLPEATTVSEPLYLIYSYNSADSKWDLIASPAGEDGADGTDGAGYGGTSTTSLTIGTGSAAFTTQAGLAYVVGSIVKAVSAADSANWMQGEVTAYSGTTLTIDVDTVGGSGTKADWSFTIAGEKGDTGAAGTNGTNGTNGTDGEGVPDGGTTGQVLAKASDTDQDVEWADPTGGSGVFSAIASQAEAEAGTDNTKGMTPLRTAEAIAALGTGGGGSVDDATIRFDIYRYRF